jgi:predicted nucleic acid-binding Zn ribbon protein
VAVSTPPERRGKKKPPRSSDAEGLSSVLDALMGDTTLRAGRAIGVLGRSWASVVGERLAEESAPAALDDQGALLVRASSAAWAAQVRFLDREIAAAANRVLGDDRVASVRVVVTRETGAKGRSSGPGNW